MHVTSSLLTSKETRDGLKRKVEQGYHGEQTDVVALLDRDFGLTNSISRLENRSVVSECQQIRRHRSRQVSKRAIHAAIQSWSGQQGLSHDLW